MQKVQTRTSARVFRARDGKRASGAVLFKEGRNGWSGLNDVNFRVGNNGRLDFTIDGEDYHSQYMPVGMQRIVASPEMLIAQMQYAGVDHCILQAGWGYGAMNDYNAFAQSQYPDRFTALLNVDEPRSFTEWGLGEFDRACGTLGLRGVYFSLDGFARYDFDVTFDEPRMEAFWCRVQQSGLPVFMEVTAVPDYHEASYVANIVRLHGLMDKYRDIRWVLVMGPPVGYFAHSGHWNFPAPIEAAYRHENLLIEVMFPITWGDVWEYPYHEAQELIRELRDKFGASKLVWGSDMPNVERFCLYRQCVDYVRRHCNFLNGSEKDAILGGNIGSLMTAGRRVLESAL